NMSNFASGEEIVITKGGTFTLSGTTSATIKVMANDIVTLKLNGVKYTGDATFITVANTNDLNIVAMLGTTSVITSNNSIAISTEGNLNVSGTGTISISAKTYGIKAELLKIQETTLNIESYGQGILVNTLNVISGKTTALSYNTSNKYDYVLDENGKYVCVNNAYILDNGNYTMDAHFSPIMPYGIVAESISVSGGTLSANSTNDIAISASNLTLSNGTVNVDAGDIGINVDTLNISGGSLNVNHSVNYGVKAENIDVTGGTIAVYSGGNGLHVDNATLNSATISIETEGNGIYAKNITIDGITCNIVTKGEFTRDDFAGIFKYSNGKYSRFLNTDLGKVSQKYKLANTAKGICAEDNITIYSCDMDITSVEAGIYSKNTMYIFGGEIKIATECDAIVSDLIVQIGYKDIASLTPNFTINISSSFVRVKSHYVECYDGVLMVYSYSDGILVEKSASDNNYLTVANHAKVYISSDEDGIDVVGNITLDGGSMMVYGGNTNTSLAIRYTKDFYYLQGELLNIGYKTLLPSKQLATTKLVGFTLDSSASSKCTRNTYIMLYEKIEEEAAPANEDTDVEAFSKVLFLGIRNYIKGITIVYGSDVMEVGKTYSLRYAASSYEGGVTPTHLPFICEGGQYNIDRCSNIEGKAIEAGVVAVLYGKHSVATGEIEETVFNGFKTLNTAITMDDYTIVGIDKGGVTKNPVQEDPSLPEDDEE
ncbi:MAG: carbohydrate-binding domain-containing protein, partial [Clostridia bacterium]|nr:carbohydrate-binding domain-containing protein [Clostridia bacterium]